MERRILAVATELLHADTISERNATCVDPGSHLARGGGLWHGGVLRFPDCGVLKLSCGIARLTTSRRWCQLSAAENECSAVPVRSASVSWTAATARSLVDPRDPDPTARRMHQPTDVVSTMCVRSRTVGPEFAFRTCQSMRSSLGANVEFECATPSDGMRRGCAEWSVLNMRRGVPSLEIPSRAGWTSARACVLER